MRELYLPTRHIACGALASALIGTGALHRAKRRLLKANPITSVYFHNPKRSLFERCVRWLTGQGYTFISADELALILHGAKACPRKAVWLSLDDGYKQWMDEVLPVVRAHGIPVTLFIPSGIVAGKGLFPWLHDPDYPGYKPEDRISLSNSSDDREAINIEELIQIARYPEVTIGCHTVNHVIMTQCTPDQLQAEIHDCKRGLERLTGARMDYFAYPAGQYDARVLQYLRTCGFRFAATTEPAFVTLNTDPLLLPRFCVPDDVTFPEAICDMIGIWRAVLDPIKALVHFGNGRAERPSQTGQTNCVPSETNGQEREPTDLMRTRR